MSAAPLRRPITPALIRAANDVSIAALPELRLLFEQVAARLHAVIATFTDAPCRVSFDGLSEIIQTLPPADSTGFACVSGHGPVTGYLGCDRSLVLALSELCFGGSGKEPAADSDDRPFSKIEQRLRQVMLGDLATQMPEAMTAALGFPFQPEPPQETVKQVIKAGPEAILQGRLLVTAFAHSGEVRVIFRSSELAALSKSRQMARALQAGGPARPTAAQLAQTMIEVSFTLPPQQIELGMLGNLHVGQLVVLDAKPHEPVLVMSEGVRLGTAVMAMNGDRLAFNIVESASGNPAASQPALNSSPTPWQPS